MFRLITGCLLAAAASAAEWRQVYFYPPEIVFSGPGQSQRFVVTGIDDHGVEQDATALARISLDVPAIASVASGALQAKTPGRAKLTVTLGNAHATAVIRVGDKRAEMVVSFSPDIISVLTTKGCNGSGCHGAIAGKNGFKLSLFGYDVKADHAMIVSAHNGRRVDLKDPEKSLLLRKPSFQIPHGGGNIMSAGSHDYQTVLQWLKQGAPLNSEGPRLTRLEVYPPERTLLAGAKQSQRLVVMGRLSDGTTRDMTVEVRYSAADESVVRVAADGTYTPVAPGLTSILARAMGKAATMQTGVIRSLAGPDYPATPSNNLIDDFVFSKMRRMNVQPASLCNDSEFLRRVFADTLGRLPTPEERRGFLAAPQSTRRSKLIDNLLEQPDYISYRTLNFEDWFRNTQLYSQGRPMGSFKDWLHQQAETDRPYDQMVRELITSSGDTNRNPSTGFWFPATDFMLNKFDVKMATPTVTRLFLGVRLECAECHNHPLENFTQDDFYGLSAFFARMRVKVGHGVYRRTWYLEDEGEVEHPVQKRPVPPKFLTGETPPLDAIPDRRTALAEWLTSPQNPFFARATVNRVWHEFFRTGIVEPFDDFRSTNAPTNRELLDELARYFTENGFRFKPLIRLILNSRAYQLSSVPQGGEAVSETLGRLLFARYYPRRLPAEVLLDGISQVTGVPHKYGGHPLGTSAKDVYIPDAPSYFLATFGFPRRDVLSERNEAPSLSQALHLMNRATLRDKLEADDNVIGSMLRQNAADDAITSVIYERAYSRLPSEAERKLLADHIAAETKAGRSRRRTLENILLVVINSKEFQLNH